MSKGNFITVFERLVLFVIVASSYVNTGAQQLSRLDVNQFSRCSTIETSRSNVAAVKPTEKQQADFTFKPAVSSQRAFVSAAMGSPHARNLSASAGLMPCNLALNRDVYEWKLNDLTGTRGSHNYSQANSVANVTRKPPLESATAPEPNFWTQETMTGDWGGARSRWKEKGVELEFKLSNFYQGVASGGTEQTSEYTGKFEMTWKFDLAKVAGWKYWSSEIKSAVRFGGPLITTTGGVNPVNTAVIDPGEEGTVLGITALNFTRLIPKDLQKGDLYAISFGRFNVLDLVQEDFFAGAGTDRFFNIAQIGPLTVLRQVPLVTNAISFATIKGGEPRFALLVLDPNDHSVDPGLDDFLADGVTIFPSYNIPTTYWGRSAKHTISGAVTTKKYTPFDAIRQIVLPGPSLNPVEPKRGSWSLNYVFRQYIVERGKRDGWGLFTQVAIADKSRSPVTRFFDIGVGGNGLFKRRQRDEFGFAYAYTDLSSVLKDNINLITFGRARLQPEHQVEMFYNFHITPWLRLTGDLQFIRGVRPVERAIVPGARLEMIF